LQLYSHIFSLLFFRHVVPKPRADCSKGEQLAVTFAAGYIAGVFCAIVSHPADVVVSKLNQSKGATAGDIVKKLGFMGMWNGLTPRIIMIGTLTALQWCVLKCLLKIKLFTNNFFIFQVHL
jgi:solute carrier family 25 phosphate transporter 3